MHTYNELHRRAPHLECFVFHLSRQSPPDNKFLTLVAKPLARLWCHHEPTIRENFALRAIAAGRGPTHHGITPGPALIRRHGVAIFTNYVMIESIDNIGGVMRLNRLS